MVNGAGIFMQALSLRVPEIHDDYLSSVVLVFIDSIPMLCDHFINDDGSLNLRDLHTTMKVLSDLEPDFWISNPYLQARLVGYF